MALKFLNKKGWHTGSLRNIENVWKAEQKRDAEEKKLEELRKQIIEERERSEFRLLQEQAGLVPKQERLDFLYDSGLSVGKGSSSDGFKALESLPKTDPQTAASSSSTKQQQPSVPGALFEEKPQSANDAWRKLHSDPLLLIRQREQEALARVKNNPVQMAMIRKSVEAKNKEKTSKSDKIGEKHHHKKPKHGRHSSPERNMDSENVAGEGEKGRNHKSSKHEKHSDNLPPRSERESRERNTNRGKDRMYEEKPYRAQSDSTIENGETRDRNNDKSRHEKYYSEGRMEESESGRKGREDRQEKHSDNLPPRSERESRGRNTNRGKDRMYEEKPYRARSDSTIENGETRDRNNDKSRHEKYYSEGRMEESESGRKGREDGQESHHKRRNNPSKLSEEERAARLQEMQMDAELHEEQRWKRLKKADEDDAQEAVGAHKAGGRNFLDAAQRSVYGAEKGGSSTIEESLRRRTHYSQRRSEDGEANAFRR
ncbi:hypothetical protein Vadar_025084 [Vaccinium darrowii]|uniref:Uncharacterized protein n=1 Tax=Vaccinium darrowii TaxID=229202 RepID=A0ACB7XCH0_9ERIC|nr:hypothetical protein Vadar_025084 [Vaccinium darrowii]